MELLDVEMVLLIIIGVWWTVLYLVLIIRDEYPARYRRLICDTQSPLAVRVQPPSQSVTVGLPYCARRVGVALGICLIPMGVDIAGARRVFPDCMSPAT